MATDAIHLAWRCVAFNLSSGHFVSKMHDIDGFGQRAVKDVLSYLGVCGHERFRTMAFELIPFGQGCEEWCIRVL